MPKRPFRSAFTLIELLVVIAIVSILAAILFPVFAQAKAAAKNAACIANEKQVLASAFLYSGDNDSVFCPAENWMDGDYSDGGWGGGEYHSWVEVCNAYVKSPEVWFNPMQSKEIRDYDKAFAGNPIVPRRIISHFVWPAWLPWNKWTWYDSSDKYLGFPTYLNPVSAVWCDLQWRVEEQGAQPAELNQVPFPAEAAFMLQGFITAGFDRFDPPPTPFGRAAYSVYTICDGEDPNCGQALGESPQPSWFRAMYPHRKTTNVGFSDGHVKNVSVKRFNYDQSLTYDDAPASAFMRAGGS